ncbi:MAG: TlpA family protein disulfide reductase [Sinobacteraceae bacterium]|nr:TlpA family protein disulfide reductase [Nevskiaceae bacterium]
MSNTYRRLWLSTLICLISGAAALAETPARATDAAGFKAALQAERGSVLIVNLWATWCVPCLREVPDLLAVTKEYEKQGVKLIGVSVDDPSPGAAVVEQFRQRYFPAFVTFARSGPQMDELASVIDPAWNEVVPTTYILDRQGKVVVRVQGKKSLNEFREAVRKAL